MVNKFKQTGVVRAPSKISTPNSNFKKDNKK